MFKEVEEVEEVAGLNCEFFGGVQGGVGRSKMSKVAKMRELFFR